MLKIIIVTQLFNLFSNPLFVLTYFRDLLSELNNITLNSVVCLAISKVLLDLLIP